jgi:hypothetical protein
LENNSKKACFAWLILVSLHQKSDEMESARSDHLGLAGTGHPMQLAGRI